MDVIAAGAVVFRPGREVLLVHRERYDDWAFPKGKLDPGEHATTAAVREVEEETGVHVRLGPPLGSQRYPVAHRMKTVHYWVGRAVGSDDVSSYEVNSEIDAVAWVPYDEALTRLTYPHDRDTLREAWTLRRRTQALVVVRHGASRSRAAWRRDDRVRPLVVAGRAQALALVPVLAAYDVSALVSSTSTRCLETLAPYSETVGLEIERQRRLSEEDCTAKAVRSLVEDLVTRGDDTRRGLAVCTHRPVLPLAFDALGIPDPGLALGEICVLHLRKGRVVATERHQPR
ncbi:MAG: NUDIX domain-containing protein [Actinobacteria bacterium]|uniref:Unannotated protein n=1 Tax=freshwater metagenome TaxID=449393 RepID=A0A6J6Q132_9ZZZZ|nr:NUDIX domain-containing protein [Actinomycetota bacterium]